jgi:hypothetical protein
MDLEIFENLKELDFIYLDKKLLKTSEIIIII